MVDWLIDFIFIESNFVVVLFVSSCCIKFNSRLSLLHIERHSNSSVDFETVNLYTKSHLANQPEQKWCRLCLITDFQKEKLIYSSS